MINRVVSVIMSFLISITGTVYSSVNRLIDSVSELLYGIPYSVEAIKDDFFGDIDDGDVVALDDSSGFVKDKLVVFLKHGTSFSEKNSFFKKIDGRLVGWCTSADMYVLSYNDMTYSDVQSRCNKLSSYDCVELAAPVTAYKAELNGTPEDDFGYSEVTAEWDELNPEGNNWWLEAIDARQAWDYSDYLGKIKIGILDAGYDLDHPDLEGKISFPSKKQANRNYEDSHGCHVAGIIGAHHNGVGIAGICDNSELVCVDWYPNGFLQYWNTELALFFGFSELVQAGAKVVNISVGTSASKLDNSSTWIEKLITPRIYSYVMSSLLSKGHDFVVVQSAGNGDYFGFPIDAKHNGSFCSINENNIFTGSYNYTADDILGRIIVAGSATNNLNGKYIQSYFTNVGDTVSLFAPGEDVYSLASEGGYELMSGTSMSAPVITGVASLVWSVNSKFTGPQVKDIVCGSTDSVAEINPEFDNYYEHELREYPMVNAKLSVEEAIKRTYPTVGTVMGTAKGAYEIVYGGVSHTVFSDGTYSFIAREGSGKAELKDAGGKTVGSLDIIVTAGQTCNVGEYIINYPATASDAVELI